MSGNEQVVFLLKCIESNGVKFDFAAVGQATGLKTSAARMRYTRLRASSAAHLDGISSRARSRRTRADSPPIRIKPTVDLKRRLNHKSSGSDSGHGDDGEDNKDQRSSDQVQPFKKRLRSAIRRSIPDLASDSGTTGSHDIAPSEHTAVVDMSNVPNHIDQPDITAQYSGMWPVIISDPRTCGSDSPAGEQLQRELMDNIKTVLLHTSTSIDDLNRLNVEKSARIDPVLEKPGPHPSVKDTNQQDPYKFEGAILTPAKLSPPPVKNRELSLTESDSESDEEDDDNITDEIVCPQDSMSEVAYRQYMEEIREKIQQEQTAAIKAARHGPLNRIISLFRRSEQQLV